MHSQLLLDNSESNEKTDEKKTTPEENMITPNEETQKKEEAQRAIVQLVTTLNNNIPELEEQLKGLKRLKDDMENQREKTETQLQSVEKQTKRDRDRCSELRKIILQNNSKLLKRRQGTEQLCFYLENLLFQTNAALSEFSKRGEEPGEQQSVHSNIKTNTER